MRGTGLGKAAFQYYKIPKVVIRWITCLLSVRKWWFRADLKKIVYALQGTRKKYLKALLVGKQVDQDSERKIFVDLDISWQLTAKNVQELGRLVFLGHQGLKMRLVLGTHTGMPYTSFSRISRHLQWKKLYLLRIKPGTHCHQNVHLDRAAWCDYDPSEITLYGAWHLLAKLKVPLMTAQPVHSWSLNV